MTTEAFIKRYIGTLDHFIEQGGWPAREAKEDAEELTAAIPALSFDGERLSKDPKKPFPNNVLLAYYKLKYQEERTESNRLYALIQGAYDKANS